MRWSIPWERQTGHDRALAFTEAHAHLEVLRGEGRVRRSPEDAGRRGEGSLGAGLALGGPPNGRGRDLCVRSRGEEFAASKRIRGQCTPSSWVCVPTSLNILSRERPP